MKKNSPTSTISKPTEMQEDTNSALEFFIKKSDQMTDDSPPTTQSNVLLMYQQNPIGMFVGG